MVRTSSPGKALRRKASRSLSKKVGFVVFAVVAIAGAVAAVVAPRRELGEPVDTIAQLVRKGPDSYFHHFFDPERIYGPIGHWDLELDTFERLNSHGVLFAALPAAPPDVNDFTMRAADLWAPGVKGADNGLIVFVFPKDHHVRVEVGYGLESALPDVEVKRLVEAYMIPSLRAGDAYAAVEAAVPALLERLQAVPPTKERSRLGRVAELVIAGREIPSKLRIVERAWWENPVGLRMLFSTIAAGLAALFAVLVTHIGRAAVLFVKRFVVRSDAAARLRATTELIGSVMQLAQVAVLLFVMLAGTSFFFPGTGGFGGAGVDVFW